MNLAQLTPEVEEDWREHIPVNRLSASSISLFTSCPESFRQKYILSQQEKMFGARFMGSADHETVAQVLRLKMLGEETPASEVKNIYRASWTNLLDALEAEGDTIDWKDDDPAEMYERGLQMSIAYNTDVVPTLNPIAVEERLEMEFDGLKLVGYADLIDAALAREEAPATMTVRERKTAGAKVQKPKSRWRFQGRIYQLMTGLPVQWDVVTRQVTTKIYTAEDSPDLRMGMVDAEVTKKMIVNAAKRMSALVQTIGPDGPWPLDGYFSDWGCDYCSIGPKYAKTCGAWT